MAVDQHRHAEATTGRAEQVEQGVVERPIVGGDAPLGLGQAQLAGVDLAASGHRPSDRAKPTRNPHRGGVRVRRQRVREHPWVELVGLAVGIDEGAREQRPQQRRPVVRRGPEQLVDVGVLELAQRRKANTRLGEKLGPVVAPRMGRGEDERRALHLRCADFDRLRCGGGCVVHGLVGGSVLRRAWAGKPSGPN